jgi:hypothetical protein
MLQLNKILLLTWVLFYYSTSFVFGQQSTIQFLNPVTNEPVVDAHVIVKPSTENETTNVIKLITNAEGKVYVEFIGIASVSVSHASFVPYSKTLFIDGQTVLPLDPITIAIDDVIVTASFTPTESKRSL